MNGFRPSHAIEGLGRKPTVRRNAGDTTRIKRRCRGAERGGDVRGTYTTEEAKQEIVAKKKAIRVVGIDVMCLHKPHQMLGADLADWLGSKGHAVRVLSGRRATWPVSVQR